MKTEISTSSIARFLGKLAETSKKEARTQTIEEIYDLGYVQGENDTIDMIEPEQICVGNKVCETLADTLKSEYLAEIFDKYSENNFRQMTEIYDKFIQTKCQEAILFAS